MRVSVFGLGYVGCVTAGCLSKDGHHVIAVDVNPEKVARIAGGLPTVVETGLDELIRDGHAAGRIVATSDTRKAVLESDISLICVGTPNGPGGNLDLTAVRSISESIGLALRDKPGLHVVINRSTVPAGTAEEIVLESLMRVSGKPEDEVVVLVVPEFLREGCAIADYYDPPFVIVGSSTGAPDLGAPLMAEMFCEFRDRIRWLPFREAEMLKALCNAFHALKVAFANEVGSLCAALSISGRSVMRELVEDKKLNISPAYLRPGLPFGGSCLPKDVRMLLSLANSMHMRLPLMRGILDSNDAHLERAIAMVRATGSRSIGIDGLSFKSGTDDLRESPIVLIAEALIGKGYDVKIYDPDIQVSYLTGANRRFVDEHLPHLSSRLVDSPEDLLESAEVIVFTRERSRIRELVAESVKSPRVVDLTLKSPPVSDAADASQRQPVALV